MRDAQSAVMAVSAIAQCLIEAMGMQAENKVREHRGEVPAYTEDAFQTLAANLEIRVRELAQWI